MTVAMHIEVWLELCKYEVNNK